MANKNEVKVQFNADAKPFTDAIQKSNSEMSKLRAELKLNETQMKNNGTSVEGLEQQHKILQNQVGAAKDKVEALSSKIEVATKYYGENSNEVIKLKTQLANAQTAHEKLGQAVKDCESKIEAEKNAMVDTRTATEKLNDTIKEQESELEGLKKKYADYVVEGKEATKEAKDLESAIGKLSNELKSSKSQLASASDKAEELAKSLDEVEDSAEDAGGGFTVLKDAMGDLVADGVQVAVEAFKELITASSEASASFQAQTGATTEEMNAFNDAMEELYANNYGESLQDIGDKMAYVKQATGEIDPTSLKNLTENAMALEDTFGSDFNETVRGVNNLMTHFGISSDEAFDLFAKGSQEGLDYTGELGDNIAEYGGNFAQAGYSADEYFQLLKNGAEGGAYNLDKVNDSINEAKNRLGDGSIEKEIGIFSKNTQTLFNEWKNGDATMKDVINAMVGDITNCTNETEALTMAQVAFGTMGEDANLDVVASLTTVGDTFEDVKGTMESVKDVKYSDVGSQFSQIGRMIQTDLLQPIVDSLMPAIEGFATFVIDNFDVIGPIIAGVAAAFTVLAGALAISGIISGVSKAMTVLNATLLANPITLIVAGIALLVTAFVGLWNNCEGFREFWLNLWDTIKTACSTAWDWISTTFSTVGEWLNTNVVQPVITFFTELWTSMQEIWDGIAMAVDVGIQLIASIIDAAFQIITLPFQFIWQNCKDYVFEAWEWIKEKVTTGITAVKDTMSNVMEGVKTAFSTAWNAIKDFLTPILDGMKNAISTAWNAIKSVTSSVFEGVKTVASNVWNGLKTVVTGVVDGVKSKITSVWDGIKNATSTAFNAVKNTATTVWNNIKTAILTPIENVKTKIKGIVDTIKGYFDGMKLKMPKISMPHFSITPKGWKVGDLLKGSVPKLSITWNKEGAIFTKPAIFNTPYGLQGVGEAGAEAILPIDKLEDYVVNAIEKTQQRFDFSQLANAIEHLADRAVELKINGRTFAETIAGASDSVNGLRNVFIERGLVLE